MPRILDIEYAGELGAANYILGVRDRKVVRFAADLFADTGDTVVNSAFVSLLDTPTYYNDQAEKLVAVNATEDGLVFVDPPTSLPSGGAAGQVLTKNSATDGDASWAEASGGTEITSSPTAPSSPVDGQLWIDESQGVQDQTNFINVTNASTDYPLRRGETAVVNYSEATSVPLHIKTAEGVYEITILGEPSGSIYTATPTYLTPNSGGLSAGAIDWVRLHKQMLVSGTDSSAYDGAMDGNTYSAFIVSHYLALNARADVFTTTKAKVVRGSFLCQSAASKFESYTTQQRWNDTTTVWSSLGTITFPFAQSGTIIIRRIY